MRSHRQATCPLAARQDPVANRGHPCLWVIRCIGQTPLAPANAHGPSIPSTESAREQNPGDDLFHEPEAQPNFVTAGIPPETTLRGHHSNRSGYLK